MKKQPNQIIIADDHAVVRTGLQLILDETNDLRIVDEASNGQELLEKLQNNTYDMVIMDIAMPGKDALDVLKEIKIKWTSLPVAIFSMNSNNITLNASNQIVIPTNVPILIGNVNTFLNSDYSGNLVLHCQQNINFEFGNLTGVVSIPNQIHLTFSTNQDTIYTDNFNFQKFC